jgi:hypothetical protein
LNPSGISSGLSDFSAAKALKAKPKEAINIKNDFIKLNKCIFVMCIINIGWYDIND